jgi:mannose-6-phosphate isomerase-like protein (cupin superfamily)
VTEKVTLDEKFAAFDEQWSPKIVAALNDYHLKIVKLEGEFVWHTHPDTDELFLVLDGHLDIQLRDGVVGLDAGELYVVPKGVEHCPLATAEARVMLIEPAGTPNTGDADAPEAVPEWI